MTSAAHVHAGLRHDLQQGSRDGICVIPETRVLLSATGFT